MMITCVSVPFSPCRLHLYDVAAERWCVHDSGRGRRNESGVEFVWCCVYVVEAIRFEDEV